MCVDLGDITERIVDMKLRCLRFCHSFIVWPWGKYSILDSSFPVREWHLGEAQHIEDVQLIANE